MINRKWALTETLLRAYELNDNTTMVRVYSIVGAVISNLDPSRYAVAYWALEYDARRTNGANR